MLRDMMNVKRTTTDLPERRGRIFLTDRHRLTVFARPPHADGPGPKAGPEAWQGGGSRKRRFVPERRNFGGGRNRSEVQR